MCANKDIGHCPREYCAASLWLPLNFELTVISSDYTAVQKLTLFTGLGSKDLITKRAVVQGRDWNCSWSYSMKRKILNTVSAYADLGKKIRADISCVFEGHYNGHARTAY